MTTTSKSSDDSARQENSSLRPTGAILIGGGDFGESLRRAGCETARVEWQPPAGGRAETANLVAKLTSQHLDPVAEQVTAANAIAMARLSAAAPTAIDVMPARTALFLPNEKALLHAGPPIEWLEMCGPMRGALLGAVLFEGWAETPEKAEALLASGGVRLATTHSAAAVAPMAGVISPSMYVWAVSSQSGRIVYSNLNEGLGHVLRFGAHSPEVLNRLRWMTAVLGPTLGAALRAYGPLAMRPLIGQALNMGDEGHNRVVALSSLLATKLASKIAEVASSAAADVLGFLAKTDHFSLNLAMATAKSMMNEAANVPFSTLVTAMARNGVSFGLQISALGDRWFSAPAESPKALYFTGYGPGDANPDLGDSAITECAGLGGFAMAAAPAIVRFVGGTAEDAQSATLEMDAITFSQSRDWTLASLNYRGVPFGIDIRRVVETRVAPIINTGVAHKLAGVGQIGAGIVRAPLACFTAALHALGETLDHETQNKPQK